MAVCSAMAGQQSSRAKNSAAGQQVQLIQTDDDLGANRLAARPPLPMPRADVFRRMPATAMTAQAAPYPT